MTKLGATTTLGRIAAGTVTASKVGGMDACSISGPLACKIDFS